MPTSLTITGLPGLPLIRPGDPLCDLLLKAVKASGLELANGDIVVLAQKIVSKSEGRYVDLALVEPSPRANEISGVTGKDARLIEVILGESKRVVRAVRGLIIVENKQGFVMANAGIDESNVDPSIGERPVLLLPVDADASARALRDQIAKRTSKDVGIVIADSFGRPWRRGTVGTAVGSAGILSLIDLRGRPDLFGRQLQISEQAVADELASAASLLMGQADEGQPAVVVRGLKREASSNSVSALLRPPGEDLFR